MLKSLVSSLMTVTLSLLRSDNRTTDWGLYVQDVLQTFIFKSPSSYTCKTFPILPKVYKINNFITKYNLQHNKM